MAANLTRKTTNFGSTGKCITYYYQKLLSSLPNYDQNEERRKKKKTLNLTGL